MLLTILLKFITFSVIYHFGVATAEVNRVEVLKVSDSVFIWYLVWGVGGSILMIMI